MLSIFTLILLVVSIYSSSIIQLLTIERVTYQEVCQCEHGVVSQLDYIIRTDEELRLRQEETEAHHPDCSPGLNTFVLNVLCASTHLCFK